VCCMRRIEPGRGRTCHLGGREPSDLLPGNTSLLPLQAVLDREHEFRFLAVQPHPLEEGSGATAGRTAADADTGQREPLAVSEGLLPGGHLLHSQLLLVQHLGLIVCMSLAPLRQEPVRTHSRTQRDDPFACRSSVGAGMMRHTGRGAARQTSSTGALLCTASTGCGGAAQ
jgi:hypothetical protein